MNRLGFGSSTRIGISIGGDAVHAVMNPGGDEHTASVKLDLTANGTDQVPALVTAFGSLARSLADSVGRLPEKPCVYVALMPPLATARLIPMPPLRQSEAELVVSRDAAKYFLNDVGPRVVAVQGTASRLRGRHRQGNGNTPTARMPILAASASARLVEGIFQAAADMGWRLEAVVPAHTAWIAAARAAVSSPAGNRVIVAQEGQVAQVITLEGERVSQLRRVPADPADIRDALGAEDGQAVVLAPPRSRSEISSALAASGWKTVTLSGPGEAASHTAARFASASSVELVTARVRAERRQRARSLASRLTAAALALVVGAAGLELWGARRELQVIRAERAAIQQEVAPLRELDDQILELRERVDALNQLAVGAPQWTRALYDLALLLPTDTHVRAVHAVGDSIRIEAVGRRAGAALQALARAESLRDISLHGNIDRVLEDGVTTVERFTLLGTYVSSSANGHGGEGDSSIMGSGGQIPAARVGGEAHP